MDHVGPRVRRSGGRNKQQTTGNWKTTPHFSKSLLNAGVETGAKDLQYSTIQRLGTTDRIYAKVTGEKRVGGWSDGKKTGQTSPNDRWAMKVWKRTQA